MGKYNDVNAIIQVIGSIYTNPELLDDEMYKFSEEDFVEKFHKILFGAIYNLHQLGADSINITAIESYLEARPTAFGIYQANKGSEYLERIAALAKVSTFGYYYKRLKKMTLLRMYQGIGLDLSWLYDIDNILDVKKKEIQEEWLDSTPIEEIANIIDSKIEEIKLKYGGDKQAKGHQAGDNIQQLVDGFIATPEVGIPLYGPMINGITRGARLTKFYLRSAAQGVGKTRMMVADACYFACNKIYDSLSGEWIANGCKEPTVYITTEQTFDEIQTIMLAFISGVNESHILDGKYEAGELDRVREAGRILADSPLYIEELPDFSLQDIEDTIKSNIKNNGVRYICYDYIHTSLKILSEVSSRAGVKGLREDNVLFMIGVRLKEIAVKYKIFIESATQLSGQYQQAEVLDQNFLRGAKSLADKIDVGTIMVKTTPMDIESLKNILETTGYQQPAIKISVYKNRRGQYENLYLWCKEDKGIARIEPMFATTYYYELIDIKDLKIEVENEDNV